jgi:3'(2'), 5'-bisphosphate nucleotidase
MAATDYRFLAERLMATAWHAGRAILSHFGDTNADMKADESPVTAADRESDALIVADLAALAPDIPVVSEESVPSPITDPGPRFFLVDPLDGTREFIARRGEFTVNIALIEQGRPHFGLVYAPALSDIYLTLAPDHAARGKLDAAADLPAFGEMAWQKLSTRAPAKDNLVAVVSRSHLDNATQEFLSVHGITDSVPGGSSIKFCLVAEGKADVYPRFGRTMEWDTAAGHAVLAAAGGVVLDEDGEPLRYGKYERGLDNPGFVAWGRAP